MVQFLPLLLTHSIRLYMAIPSICRTVLTDLVLKSNIHWLCNERSFTSLKDIKSWNRIIRKGLKKNHQTHQTLSKKKSKHVKSIQVIHVYITVQIWVFGPIRHSQFFATLPGIPGGGMPGGMPGIPGGTIPLRRFPMARPLFESKENFKTQPNLLLVLTGHG